MADPLYKVDQRVRLVCGFYEGRDRYGEIESYDGIGQKQHTYTIRIQNQCFGEPDEGFFTLNYPEHFLEAA